jgi:hypothetical protein
VRRLLLVLAAATAAACSEPTSAPGTPGSATHPRTEKTDALLVPETRVAPDALDEGSGLVRWNGAWWALEDSGAPPALWRATALDFADAVALEVPGAANVDWEDLAPDGDTLLVTDLGDNLRARGEGAIHRVRLASGAPLRLERVATYPVRWPDGKHDCEAVAVIDGALHAIVKDRGEGSLVFAFGPLSEGGPNVPSQVGTLDLGDREQATSAVFDAASRSLVVLTYTQVARWPADRLSGSPADTTWIGARQAEALAIDGDDLVFTNEQRDVFRIRGFRAWPFARLLPPRVETALRGEETTLPLADGAEGDEVAWRFDGATLHVRARLRLQGDAKTADTATNRLGSGLLLAFGREDRRHVSGEETLVAVTYAGDGKAAVHRVAPTAQGLLLEEERFVAATAGLVEGGLGLRAEIPATLVFRGAAPPEFRLYAQGVGLGRTPPPRFGGPDAWALWRPYLWALVRR